MKLYHLKIAVVQAFKEGGKLGIAVISHIKVGETLSQEISYLCKDNRLVLAVVLDEKLGDGLLDLIDGSDRFLYLVNGGHLGLGRRHGIYPSPGRGNRLRRIL